MYFCRSENSLGELILSTLLVLSGGGIEVGRLGSNSLTRWATSVDQVTGFYKVFLKDQIIWVKSLNLYNFNKAY